MKGLHGTKGRLEENITLLQGVQCTNPFNAQKHKLFCFAQQHLLFSQ